MRYCTRCGHEIPPDDQFCTVCGTHAQPPKPAEQPRSPKTSRPPWHRRWPVVTGILLAAGAFGVGVAVILAGSSHDNPVSLSVGQTPLPQSASSQNPQTTASASQAPSSPPPSPVSSGSGLTSPPPSPTSAASPSETIVSVATGAEGDPDLQPVTALLQSYFTAINQHDYAAYASLLAPSMAQQNSASVFASGYGSTTDTDATLNAISAASSSGLAATVMFTSHQQPTESPDNSACDNWTITLYLVPDGSGYLITKPPSSYHAEHSPC